MLIQDLRPGARTDLALHRFGAQILELPDCLAVRTPSNPSFYWGNYLMLPQAPADADLPHWLQRFDELIARPQPASRHVAIGINTIYAGQQLPAWEAAGFEMFVNSVMRLAPGQLCPPARAPRGDVLVRPIDFATEVPAIVELECADTHGFGEAGYREYRERQFVRYAQMHEQGCAQWFGLWCDGQLAADCGLMRMAAQPGGTVRFQRVATHPAWRRRGLASVLVHSVSAYALNEWQAAETIMIADPDDVAIGIYRSLGYRELELEWGLQRKSPDDRG